MIRGITPEEVKCRGNIMTGQVVKQPIAFVIEKECVASESIIEMLQSVDITVQAFLNPDEFVLMYDAQIPGCIVFDLDFVQSDGIIVTEQIAEKGYCSPCIMISAHWDEIGVARAMKGGAIDFMKRPLDRSLLVKNVHGAFREDIQQRSVLANRCSVHRRFESLSARERQVLALIMAGRLSKQICCEHDISIKTVESHRSNIVRKMHATSLIQVASMIASEHLICSDGSSFRISGR